MSELQVAGAPGRVMGTPRHHLPPSEQRIVEELIDEHVRVSCQIVPIDAQTWAIHGLVAVDGEVILAEFDDPEDAELALEQLAASANDSTLR